MTSDPILEQVLMQSESGIKGLDLRSEQIGACPVMQLRSHIPDISGPFYWHGLT